MEPSVPVHALAFVRETSAASVREGDIITFTPPGRPARVTHRVVKREQRGSDWFFETKGDANPSADDWGRFLDLPEQRQTSAATRPKSSGSAHAAGKRQYTRAITYGSRPAVRYVWHVPQLGRLATFSLPAGARAAMVLLPLGLVTLWLLTIIWSRPIEKGSASRRHTGGHASDHGSSRVDSAPLAEYIGPLSIAQPPPQARDAA